MKLSAAIGTIALSILLLPSLNAQLKLPAIVSSNMVLQREANVSIWGWAAPNKKVTIKCSWLQAELDVKVNPEGRWQTSITTTGSKSAQEIIVKSAKEEITLDNILFGEVWLCSGQSNMEQPVSGFNGQPTFGSQEAIVSPKNPNLRLFTVERAASKLPNANIEKYRPWQEANPETVSDFSAVAYFYGSKLQEMLDVPVGMIHTSWGGSKVEAWMGEGVLKEFQEFDLAELDVNNGPHRKPTFLFNAMINPLIPYTIKGALWYQGESNRDEPEMYKKLFPAMVKDWRTRWGIGEFPFYYVQIAPFLYGDNEVFQEVKNSAFMREAQVECVDLIPNSGIAITIDIGEQFSIHPPKKIEVAHRLLYNALNQTYGFASIDGKSPVFDKSEIVENGLLLSFNHAENGLYAFDELEGFEIAGEDRVFYPAQAQIMDRKQVLVNSEKVINPVAVRYAWRNWIRGTLYDTNLLPASSFRSDRWEDAVKAEN